MFSTSFSELSVPAAVCTALEGALDQGPRTVLELADSIGQPPVEVVRLAALLLHDERLGLDRGEAGLRAQGDCERVNTRLLRLMGEGRPYTNVAVASLGGGISLSHLEALCCLAPGQGPLGSAEGRWLLGRLEELGIQLRDQDGRPLKAGYASLEDVLNLTDTFQRERLPSLQELGVFLARFPSRSHGDPS